VIVAFLGWLGVAAAVVGAGVLVAYLFWPGED
jgi:hypothetical protein